MILTYAVLMYFQNIDVSKLTEEEKWRLLYVHCLLFSAVKSLCCYVLI